MGIWTISINNIEKNTMTMSQKQIANRSVGSSIYRNSKDLINMKIYSVVLGDISI